MTAHRARRTLVRLLAPALLALGVVVAGPVTAGSVQTGQGAPLARAADGLAPWTGEVSLYRPGTFTTQASWLWCTAADVQIARNIVYREVDHSSASQRQYFNWMRGQNRYDIPLSGGVDAAGWAAGMAHYVDERYQLVASASFDEAIRSAATNLRLTGLPVALAVSHGNHGWLLTGFAATADPAVTADFTITTLRVVGPLYGLQSRNGYDMMPNTRLTLAQLRTFFTPWRYPPVPMTWDGTYVSIQPVPAATTAAAPTPMPTSALEILQTPGTSIVPTPGAMALAGSPAPTTPAAGPASSVVPAPSPLPWIAALAAGVVLVVVLLAVVSRFARGRR